MNLAPGQTVICIDANRRGATRSPFKFGERYSVTRSCIIDEKQFVDLAGVEGNATTPNPAWSADRFRPVEGEA